MLATRTIDRFPGIKKAMLAIAYDNNFVGNTDLGGQTEDMVLDSTETVLAAEGVYEDDLKQIDTFLQALSEADMDTLCCGEHNDQIAVASRFQATLSTQEDNAPAILMGLLTDLFENG